jgi:hypothetical protein
VSRQAGPARRWPGRQELILTPPAARTTFLAKGHMTATSLPLC